VEEEVHGAAAVDSAAVDSAVSAVVAAVDSAAGVHLGDGS
jgi:hypothetical protein